MKILLRSLIILCSVIAGWSCASYKTQYAKEAKNWQSEAPDPKLELKHTMYLIGDAGNDSPEHPAPVLEYLKVKLASEPETSSALFMGDNIYEYGMPPAEDSVNRKVAEYRIDSQLETLKDFKGYPIFMPGNHDWRGWGVKGVKRQQKYIQKYINENRGVKDKELYEDYFLPKDGCSGPEVVELNDNIVVIVVDSQWWLTDWDKDNKINEGCEIKNREQFGFVFENVIRKYRNKNVVIAMHHPPYTYGPHGGKYTIKQHIFPLTEMNPKLWIPLPIIGTLSAVFRGTIGSRQDIANRHYKDLRKTILAGAKKNGNFIFASGHEHTLQFIENDEQEFIVSGSGSKNSPVGMGKGSQFATTSLGFSTLNFYEGGETWVKFWKVSTDGKTADIIYQKKIDKRPQISEVDSTINFTEYEEKKDSVTRFVTKETTTVGGFHKFFLGEHNRPLYIPKYSFPVLDLAAAKGGLVATKQGGGNQTNSLRLESKDGREYVLRGLSKDVSRFLPFPFNKMIAAQYIAEDNFLSTNPFAPLNMPALADAIKVYHTNPILCYVPAQPALGTFNNTFGGTMNLFEERADGKKWKDAAFFGNPDKITKTPDLVEDMLESPENRVDEPWALRTRLLDFLVGDWDRHDDQWAWAVTKQPDGTKIHRPIPRDRDQAFSDYDGLAVSIAHFTMPFLRQLQSFNPDVKNVKWTTWSARLYDRTFINSLDWKAWEKEIEFVQQHMTDDVIEKSFENWPDEARKIAEPYLIKSMKSRRDQLKSIARKHYEFVSKTVNVIGTEEKERFVIERLDNDHTTVTVYEISKKGNVKSTHFQRTFENNLTRSVNLYGNGDDDEFIVRGDVSKSILIRMIGGTGKDLFIDSSRVQQPGAKALVYDDLGKNTVQKGPDTKDKRTSLYRFNVYDRRSTDSNYDITMPMPIVGYNPDDGVVIGANANYIRYGFKKEPYASRQIFGGAYAFGTKAFRLNYTGDFINAFKSFDFYLDTYYHGPSFTFNYAGLGNESVRPVDDPNYYRAHQSSVYIYPAIKKRFAGTSGFMTLGPFAQYTDLEATPGRYITSPENGLPDDVYDSKYFGGGKFLFDFSSVDNLFAPHTGIKFRTEAAWTKHFNSSDQFVSLKAQFSYYTALDTKENLILATQAGTGLNFGKGFEFFQMPTLGGKQGLRGYRTERFYGKSAFWHDTDLRWRIGSSYNPALPLTYGLFGSFDYGRVWLEEYPSNDWHFSYGGGIWFAPVDILTLAVGAFIPKEKNEEKPRISFQLGYWF